MSKNNNNQRAKKTGKQAKDVNLKRALSVLSLPGTQQKYLEKVAKCIVAPDQARPMIFPSPVPGRMQTARFILTREVSGDTDLGIICAPDLNRPLMISHGAPVTAAASPINSSFETNHSGVPVGGKGFMQGCVLQDIQAIIAGVKFAGLSVHPDGAAVTANCNISCHSVHEDLTVELRLLNSDATTYISAGSVTLTSHGPTAALSGVSFGLGRGGYTLLVSGASGANLSNVIHVDWATPTGGTWSCSLTDTETSMDVFAPEWDSILSLSNDVRVAACSCLVTYVGSTLNNKGAISVCNAEEELPIKSSFYETCASRPHDKYEGRLASEGNTEGGAHWHYVPDSILTLESNPSQDKLARGYFGIKGKDANEPVKITCCYILNFYTTDPSHVMEFQPPFTGFSSLLSILRHQVPLVSSNDSHLTKIVKAAKLKAQQGLKYAVDNPAVVGRALSMLL